MEVHLVPQIFGRGEVHCQNDGLYDVRLAIVRRLILKKRQRSQSLSRVTKKSGLSSFAPSGPASSALPCGRHCAGHSACVNNGFCASCALTPCRVCLQWVITLLVFAYLMESGPRITHRSPAQAAGGKVHGPGTLSLSRIG